MRKFILTLGVGLFLSTFAYAEGGACTMDVQKFCDGVQPGDGRIQKCLKDHKHELSEGCVTDDKEAMDSTRKHRKRHKKKKNK